MRLRIILLTAFLLLTCAATVRAQGVQSVYTDLSEKRCKTLELDTSGAGYSLQRCPGVAGYKLLVEEGDLRQNITIVRPGGSKHALNLWNSVGGGGFSSVGSKAEWRVRRRSGRRVPVALIVRFNVVENPETPEKSTSYLTVAKITPQQICVTDAVRPHPDANQEARRLADVSAGRPCLPSPQ